MGNILSCDKAQRKPADAEYQAWEDRFKEYNNEGSSSDSDDQRPPDLKYEIGPDGKKIKRKHREWNKPHKCRVVNASVSVAIAAALTALHPTNILFDVSTGLNVVSVGYVWFRGGHKTSSVISIIVAGGAAVPTIYFTHHWVLNGLLTIYTYSSAVGELAHPAIHFLGKQARRSVLAEAIYGSRTFSLADQGRMIKRILAWAWPDKFWWGAAYGSMIASTILSSLMPQLFSGLIRAVTSKKSVWPPVQKLTVMVFVLSVIEAGNSILFAEAGTRLGVRIQKILMRNVMKQDQLWFDHTTAGDILTQLGASGGLISMVSGTIPAIIRSLVSMTTVFIVLSRYHPTLAFITAVAVPFEVLSSYWYSKLSEKYEEKVQAINARSSTIITELMGSIKTVRVLGAEKEQLRKFWKTIDELIKLRRANNWIMAGTGIVEVVIPHITSMLMFLYAGSLVKKGVIDASALVTVSMYQGQMTGAFSTLAHQYISWGGMMGSNKKVFEYMDRVPAYTPRGEQIPEKLAGTIQFNDVTFGYNPANPILEHFSLNIKAGEVVALVGPSGGGKSTFLNLVTALYDPQEGKVFLDDKPVHEYQPVWLYSKGLTVVSQEPVLFSKTFAQNITLGLEDVPMEKIEEAAKQANAHEFIMETSDGYDTQVGQRGDRLSGGQKQRVAIARALVRDPSILLLDEATSALDAESEFLVQEAIERLMKGRTVIIVAHRLSTVQNADRILVLEKGQVVQEGTHKDLVKQEGTYLELVKRQLMKPKQGGKKSNDSLDTAEELVKDKECASKMADADGKMETQEPLVPSEDDGANPTPPKIDSPNGTDKKATNDAKGDKDGKDAKE